MPLHIHNAWEKKAMREYNSAPLGEGISEGAHGYINGAADMQHAIYNQLKSKIREIGSGAQFSFSSGEVCRIIDDIATDTQRIKPL